MSITYELIVTERQCVVAKTAVFTYLAAGIGDFTGIPYVAGLDKLTESASPQGFLLLQQAEARLAAYGIPIVQRLERSLMYLRGGKQTLSSDEADYLVKALEAFGRVHLGQLSFMVEVLHRRAHPSVTLEVLQEIERDLDLAACHMTGLPIGASWGVRSPQVKDSARIAWDMRDVIRHRRAWDRTPSGGWTVDFDQPLVISSEPLCQIRAIPTEKHPAEASPTAR